MHPGVRTLGRPDRVLYHDYYKWMYFYIAVMIIMLHAPRQLWRSIEGGKMKAILEPMKWNLMAKEADSKKMETNLVDYLFTNLGYHNNYALGFVFCEMLNVAVVSVLLFIWDMLSDYQLSANGWTSVKNLQAPVRDRNDSLAKVFPVLSKCTMNIYGPSGNVVPGDALCVLPLNIVNERAAVFFW